MSSFVHLHTHSHYSLLNALPTVRELVEAAKADGMDALALTDNGNLYGAVEFYQQCKKEGIKPIIGIDAYLAPRTRHDREAQIDKPRARIVLLAKTTAGYKNLIKLVTESYIDGFYYRPRLDRELIEKYRDGLVCIIPSFAGETSHSLKAQDTEKAHALISWYKSQFGDDCYLEITHHPEIPGHEELQENIRTLAEHTNTPLVATHDVYYINPEDRLARETMVKIQTGGTVETTDGFDEYEEDFSFISQKKAQEYFKDIPSALENSVKIAEQCNVEIEIGTWYFPDYIIESGKSPDEELSELAYKGIVWRGLDPEDPVIRERIAYELDIIKMKGYAKYFLVVGDLLREARKRKILTTIRGSVAGSLTTYVLGITNVNPIEYKLPFERFLNPERPSAPDIDMDYADNRRDEIIAYAKEKYGADKVAQIGTFGKMLARAVVRDVARALNHPYATGDRIAKLIPFGSQGFPMTIERALALEPDLKELYEKDAETREVIDLAKKIEGRVRHVGVHAAGVVIAPAPLTDFVPLQYEPKSDKDAGGNLITQYDMHTVGEDGVGLLKFDFLGIKNLSILADAVDRVRAIRGIEIDIENIPLDDKKTFEMLARGETMGLFQLNGSGMTHFLKDLRPSSIHDINAMVALYRPGPMESIPQYIERKHNPHLINYLDPRMKEYLEFSYGLLVYQDDVLLTAIKLASYSWLEADMLRKAMGKKIPKVMAAEKEKLIVSLIKNGMTETKAQILWKFIEPFAAYGFGKAHAASYGRVAYQTAYMKANFPVEYMSAVLTADSGNIEKISEIIHECERMGIEILPPDINESFAGFSVVPNNEDKKIIRFGLTTIKNFGEGIAESIIRERKANGPYISLADFLTRVQDKNLNKKSLEALIMAGTLDRFAERGALMGNLDRLLDFNHEQAAQLASAHDSLFATLATTADAGLTLAPMPTAPASQKLLWEKELLGVFVSGHPLDSCKDAMKKYQSIYAVVTDEREGIPVTTSGLIEDMKEIMTKKGDHMAFIRLADWEHSIEMVVFPSLLKDKQEVLQAQNCIAVKGRLSYRNGQPSIVAEMVKSLV
ncbi:DNA polymerase III subunit alpha [Candidatus Kaiserbacteria bacterium]|nr:DNA polymerase III subunit alpha [Candidatus Kaiserbacteria bacterium]